MDVLWFRLSRRPSDPEETTGRFDIGRIFVMINRGAYWQCGFVIPKGSLEELRERGLEAFRDSVARIAPFAADRVGELPDWDAVKLLTVRVDRLLRWYRTGLLCIGDAAHAMSPIGGVGINLAIQDAVAAANALADPPHPADAAIHPEPRHHSRPGKRQPGLAPAFGPAPGPFPAFAQDTGEADRDRVSARARQNAQRVARRGRLRQGRWKGGSALPLTARPELRDQSSDQRQRLISGYPEVLYTLATHLISIISSGKARHWICTMVLATSGLPEKTSCRHLTLAA